ncbi:RNA exonuclease 1 homolog [Conger conger]|uniref:RNA exonuclease 1 homolog n=1 Tax=Conger conger TaxID=82655 RepID=UPI002A59B5AE|nr:RNA exonuclease 1 homolog [Conger conger]XP_061093911.1 RNA exonuclease 1 homolog [Conger conger]
MLRSTGFFRGIDCPFYGESCNGRIDGDGCHRPYCHFRHSKLRRASCSANSNRKSKESCSKQNELAYDPCNPEVVRPGEARNGEPASDPSSPAPVDQGALELERVNRAIEAVRSEVEREQKKLSRIGDQEYDPTASATATAAKRPKPSAAAPPLEYDPGSYQMSQAADYNPTPRSSKYTLDSDGGGSSASSLEYVPTAVAKKAVKKRPPPVRTPRSPSPPSSPPPVPAKTPYVSSSSKHKYTLDNSKPPTDLEYDPLSNYSSRPGSKGAKGQAEKRGGAAAGAVAAGGRKRLLSSGVGGKQAVEEGYVPTFKKPRQQAGGPAVDSQKYTASFSESDEESSGTEYRPTSLNRLQQRKGIGGYGEGGFRKGGESVVGTAKERRVSEVRAEGPPWFDSEGSDGSGPGSLDLDDRPAAKKTTAKGGLKKPSADGSEPSRKSGGQKEKEKAGEGKKMDSSKKPGKEESKKHGKTEGRKAEEKNREKERERSLDKNGSKEGKKAKSDSKKDPKGGKTEKSKGDSGSGRTEKGGGGSGSSIKKVKSSDKLGGKESCKPRQLENGKLEGRGDEKARKRDGLERSDGRKDRPRKSSTSSSSEGRAKKAEKKQKQRSLTHVDLFGDESVEEEEEEDDEADEEGQETVVRKSAAAFRRGSFAKSKRRALTPSSSENDDDGDDRYNDYEDDADADYTHLQVDLDYEEDPMEECLRIFNESKDVKTEDKGRQAKQAPKELEEDPGSESTLTTLFPGQKKRVSHFMAKGNVDAAPKPVVRPYRRPTAQEICYQRMQVAQQQAAELAAAVKTKTATATPASAFPGERKRVAHRPSQSAPALKSGGADSTQAGGQVTPPIRVAPGQLSIKAHTSVGILSKTTSTVAQKRVAHTPTMKSSTMKRPIIPTEFGAKVPTNVRQRYLNIFIDECLKFCPSEDTAFEMALQEEKVVYDRSSSRNIYLNVAVNTLKKLRGKSGSSGSPVAKSPAMSTNRKTLSHEEVLGGRLAAKTSFSINRTAKPQEEKLVGANLYRKLKEYVMTEEQLQEHCYPRPHPDRPGRAIVYNMPEKKNVDPFSKVCCRCGAEYKITPNGNCVRKEECCHHWGRLRRYKAAGGWETQYSCCSGAVGSQGCQVAKQHVQDGRKEALDSYVTTFEKHLPFDGDAGVYALDCEMCYTKQGLELTRVTVINAELKVIYDTFVKPESKVVDYNTRFSGVTEDDMEGTTITLRDVQAVLLNMFSADSILIGHSLESDLFALKLIHSTVVDTAIVFPHRLGLPYKRALRNLMADYLKRIIQDNVEGHDSSEDASACMQLMMWKIREDTKVKR